MTAKTHIHLQNLFIYNPTLGTKEDEGYKKILYYYPEGVDGDIKLRNVGLCEALVNFTRTFEPSKPCEVLHTQKTRQFFLQPEPNFWMVMTVGLPTQQRSRDGRLYVEYLPEEVQDDVYGAVLDATYRTFRLFAGTFSGILSRNGAEQARLRLKRHFDAHVPSLQLQHADLLDVFRGIQFLPLDRQAFLKVQCFVNVLQSAFGQIKYTVFLCNDQLVWSGLERDDVRVLHHFLGRDVLRGAVESELRPGFSARFRQSTGSSHARFLLGSTEDEGAPERILRVYPSADEECRLLVFRAYSATLCMLVDPAHETDSTFPKELEAFLSSELTTLANEIGRNCAKLNAPTPVEAQSKYIYFNRLNLAQKSSIHSERRACVPNELVRFLADVHRDLELAKGCGEIVAKTTGEWWVVGKSSDGRELYVVHNQKSANIVQIGDEVKKLCSTQFNNIFFLD